MVENFYLKHWILCTSLNGKFYSHIIDFAFTHRFFLRVAAFKEHIAYLSAIDT